MDVFKSLKHDDKFIDKNIEQFIDNSFVKNIRKRDDNYM